MQKRRGMLIGTGAGAVIVAVLLFLPSIIWVSACGLFAGCIGIYLLMWGIVGKGYWCRTCKRIPPDMQ
ncbi:MAG: hypothetical protein ACP5O1_01805 [Phycisphaerae bacterium]